MLKNSNAPRARTATAPRKPKKVETPKKGSLTFDVTIQTRFGKDDEFYQWETDGLIYAEMLSRADCPAAFRQAFNRIFTDHLYTKVEPTHPCLISAFFPLVMLSLQESVPADAETAVSILRTLRETLAPELTEQILGELYEKGVAR
jgi:hypothetical protein